MAEDLSSHQKQAESPRGQRLETWGEIASYLGREIRTVQRWEKSMGLPVHRLGGASDKSRVFAFRSELDTWWKDHETRANAADSESAASLVAVAPATPHRTPNSAQYQSTLEQLNSRKFSTRRALSWKPVLAGAVVVAVLLTILIPKLAQRWWPSRVVLAVQPFQNLGSREDDSIAAGLTEEMITRLSQLHPDRMSVVALTAANGKASSLHATYLLRGTIRHYGSQVAITAQLIQASNQNVVWGQSYERDVKDLLRVQAEVADSIASEVFIKLPHFAAPVREVNREAYLSYLEGRYFWKRRTGPDLLKATASFEKSIRVDPTYAPAYAGLADCYELSASAPYTVVAPRDAFPKAEAAARKALDLDPSLAEAHVSLGYADLAYEWDVAAAGREFQRAIELSPRYATAHQYYGYSLTAAGRLPEAIAERKRAEELDPINPLMASAVGEAYYQARQFDRTIEQNQRALDLDPAYAIALVNIGRAYQQKGMHAEAQAAFQKILLVAPDDPAVLALLGHEYAVSGRRNDALQISAKLKAMAASRYVPALYVALVSVGLGDKDDAFRWMDTAVQERTEYLVYLATEPLADPLRTDPRFADLVRSVGLKPATVEKR